MREIDGSTGPTTEVLFFDGFDDLDSVGPFEILVAAGFSVRPVRPSGTERTVRSAHGLELTITGELGADAGLLVVPGGGWRDNSAAGVRAQCRGDLPRRLAALHERGTVLASVCTGAMLLAAAGVLAGRPAVTNRIAIDDLRAAGADVLAEARVVDDGSVVTCGGPAAGLDLAVHLVARYRGATAGERAAERLEHEPVGPAVVGTS
jgi:transcriptional regulator GlxA family with amidase domain